MNARVFDDAVVEAAAKAIHRMNYPRDDWENAMGKGNYRRTAHAALSAVKFVGRKGDRHELEQLIEDHAYGRDNLPMPLAAVDAILDSPWLAAHDADLRERIAQAIEAAKTGDAHDDNIRAQAARIAREVSL